MRVNKEGLTVTEWLAAVLHDYGGMLHKNKDQRLFRLCTLLGITKRELMEEWDNGVDPAEWRNAFSRFKEDIEIMEMFDEDKVNKG